MNDQVEQIVPQLWTSVVLFASLLIFKVSNTLISGKVSDSEKSVVDLMSETDGSKASTAYQEIF